MIIKILLKENIVLLAGNNAKYSAQNETPKPC